jgi:hypothetical protein
MKINDVIVEKQIDEVPAGGLSQLGNKLGGKLLNKVPGAAAKSKAANMLGKADLGDTANNLHKELNQYIGRQGKNMKQLTGEDFAEFLRFKKHKTAAKIPSGVLQKAQLDQLLNTASKEALAGKGGVQPGDTTPGATKAPPAGGQQTPAAGPQAGKAVPQAKIPDNILAQINKMDPKQKQQLAGMLQ